MRNQHAKQFSVRAIPKKFKISEKIALKLMDEVSYGITEILSDNGEFYFPYLGKLYVYAEEETQAFNPLTDECIDIPRRYYVACDEQQADYAISSASSVNILADSLSTGIDGININKLLIDDFFIFIFEIMQSESNFRYPSFGLFIMRETENEKKIVTFRARDKLIKKLNEKPVDDNEINK